MNELKKNNQQILKIFCVIMLTARKNYVSTTTRSKFKRKSGINNFSLLPHRQSFYFVYTQNIHDFHVRMRNDVKRPKSGFEKIFGANVCMSELKSRT